MPQHDSARRALSSAFLSGSEVILDRVPHRVGWTRWRLCPGGGLALAMLSARELLRLSERQYRDAVGISFVVGNSIERFDLIFAVIEVISNYPLAGGCPGRC